MSDFLNTPTAGDRWCFPVHTPGQPMRAIGHVQAPDVVTGHQQQAAAMIADWLQDGGTPRAVDRLANVLAQHEAALAERDAAAASLHDADQATIARLAGKLAATECTAARLLDYIGILRVAAGLPALRTDEELAAVIAAALKRAVAR